MMSADELAAIKHRCEAAMNGLPLTTVAGESVYRCSPGSKIVVNSTHAWFVSGPFSSRMKSNKAATSMDLLCRSDVPRLLADLETLREERESLAARLRTEDFKAEHDGYEIERLMDELAAAKEEVERYKNNWLSVCDELKDVKATLEK